MKIRFGCVCGVLAMTACSTGNRGGGLPDVPRVDSTARSGIDTQYVENEVRPQDDLYVHLNGKWLANFQIPADKGVFGSFTVVDDTTQEQLRSIVDDLGAISNGGATANGSATANGGATDPDARKLADFYASFMDEARLDSLGVSPLRARFAAIDAMKNKSELPALIAHINESDAGAPYDISIDPDSKDSTRYAVSVAQSGLGLPDRDYYLKDDAKFKDIRVKYVAHVANMLGLAGERNSDQSAAEILKLETAMANLQWTRVANRDPEKTYNKTTIAQLAQLMPGYDWAAYLQTSELAGKIDYVIINQPSYFQGLARLIADTPLPVWKSYFKWHVLSAAAPLLSKPFVDERFAFTGTALRGIPDNLPRWKRGLRVIDGSMGEAIGKLYVQKYFPPDYKARMQSLVGHLIEAYRRDIVTLDWMGPQTKLGAQAKLDKMAIKIGYPDKWRDYGALQIDRADLYGNVQRAVLFEYRRGVAKLGKPIDRSEWLMSPQTVNAYYNPVMNEIVFPAAILQPPFFDAAADDAVNYGGIVAVIGHEVSHAFDDEGSQYDADGNLHDWFTPEDHAKFAAKTKALIAQYDAYEPVAGYHVNGELTLGENIADNAGLAVAYKAYELSLNGKPAPTIGGFTGEQRFYLGWVQVWRGKVRQDQAIERIKTDPHSPPEVRGTAPVKNQPGFYSAFGVKPGDHMFLAPPDRVILW